ncbi:MAG: CDP-glycerol glycerophosphotransferase family protein [Caldibacillus debilis]|uniref:CDP-glycerol glycerophosphotransferase family protein n=2 Tax=Caldibacillus debilis TaxID=301148 RepID=A0A3E0K4H9_9BACI|nr:MAG: CDP-glycerol glycerophosphotransferase family protein [Caldibacillus debilis]REJ28357.1 MAG: CDP-glycerol glycerophosphotransferase family protein [Caldibacillus debilis]REJ30181.1 MAG: CDP-glycerol glycerophosphotransferase family protein [Caldibacillus debilis]
MNIQNHLKRILKKIVAKAYWLAFSVAASCLPVKKRLIMFESYLGKQYSCNPRAIYEYMKETHPNYHMFWSVDKGSVRFFQEKGIPYIKRFSLKWLIYMARAEYWITNSRMPLWLTKPKHTVYVQTWHGTPLKKLALDMNEVHMPGTNTEKYKKNFTKESAKWDFLLSPNAYSTEIFRRAFDFHKTIIESGYPRNDYLYNYKREDVEKIKKQLNLPLDKKVILYAPTWRDNQFYQVGKYKFNLRLDLDLMKEKLGEEYILLLRMHYLVAESLDLSRYEGFAFDVSKVQDIRELYVISDMLITDYSSVFFDYANLKRPMLFYVYDIDEYRDVLRGFYFDIEKEAPGPLVYSTEEIIEKVNKLKNNDESINEAINRFYKKFCYLDDGEATKRVVDRIFLNKPS